MAAAISCYIRGSAPGVVLSASMKMWDADKGWECTHTFGSSDMLHLAFNPEDLNSFACATWNNNVEIWSLNSPVHDYTLNGHSDIVLCLDFLKRGDRLYLITGSRDCTAKTWDLQKRACINTIDGFMSPVVHVISLPGRPYLVTCSNNATLHVWSSTDFRLKTIVNFSSGGGVKRLVCLMGSRRIAIGQENSISIMDIDDHEDVVPSEGNNEDTEYVEDQLEDDSEEEEDKDNDNKYTEEEEEEEKNDKDEEEDDWCEQLDVKHDLGKVVQHPIWLHVSSLESDDHQDQLQDYMSD